MKVNGKDNITTATYSVATSLLLIVVSNSSTVTYTNWADETTVEQFLQGAQDDIIYLMGSPVPCSMKNGQIYIKESYTFDDTTYITEVFLDPYTGTVPPDLWPDLATVSLPTTVKTIKTDGTSITDSIEDWDDTLWYSFSASGGNSYTIETTGESDPSLSLFGKSGGLLEIILVNYDKSWMDENAKIVWNCSSSGTYYVAVEGWCDDGYTISVNKSYYRTAGEILVRRLRDIALRRARLNNK